MNTYGATREKLIANGYIPTSATVPGAHGYKVADDPAAVLCAAQSSLSCGVPDAHLRSVFALTVTTRDKAVRAEILAVLGKHVGKGPVRIDSAGNETHVLRPASSYAAQISIKSSVLEGETEPAAVLDSFARPEPFAAAVSHVIRLDGTWKNGSLLDTSHDKLPTLNDAAPLFADIEKVLRKHAPRVEWVDPQAVNTAARRERRLRLESEIAKRTDATIWSEVDRRLNRAAGLGVSAWDKAAAEARAEKPQVRIETYDAIVAERDEAEAIKARRARFAGA